MNQNIDWHIPAYAYIEHSLLSNHMTWREVNFSSRTKCYFVAYEFFPADYPIKFPLNWALQKKNIFFCDMLFLFHDWEMCNNAMVKFLLQAGYKKGRSDDQEF